VITKNRRIKKNINGRPRPVCCRPPWSRRTVCCGCGWDLRANRRVETPSVPVSPAAGSRRTPAWIDRPLPKTTATSWALTKRLFLCWECCSRCRFQSYDYIIIHFVEQIQSTFNFVNGHVSTMWFMVCERDETQSQAMAKLSMLLLF